MKGSSSCNVAFFSEHYVAGKMQKLNTDSEMITMGGKRHVCCGVGGGEADDSKRVYGSVTGRNYRLLFYCNGADPVESEK
jgi:hypothetical protein